MASSTPHTILIRVNGGERPIYEAPAHTANVTPGDFLLLTGSGVTPNASAGDADGECLVAVENPYLDPRVDTSPAIDTDYDYASGETVRYIIPQRGDIVYAWLETSGNVALGAALEIGSQAGTLQALASGRLLAFAAEALNNSSGSPARLKVRIA
jgi:hypothetical protein